MLLNQVVCHKLSSSALPMEMSLTFSLKKMQDIESSQPATWHIFCLDFLGVSQSGFNVLFIMALAHVLLKLMPIILFAAIINGLISH